MHIVLLVAVLYLGGNLAFAAWRRRRGRVMRAWRQPVLTVIVIFAACAFGAVGASRLPSITLVPPDPTFDWMPARTLTGLLTAGAIASGLVLLYLTLKEVLRIGSGVAGWFQRRLS